MIKLLIDVLFVFVSIPHWCKTQEMCDKVNNKDPFTLIYYLNRYKTQKMCNDAVDDCLGAWKLIPDWFVTGKLLEKFHDANDDILFLNEDFNEVTFFANQIDILAVDLDKIDHDDVNNFDEDDSDTIIHVRLLAWHSKFEKGKTLKKRQAKI